MLHTKLYGKRPDGFGEEDIKGFLQYLGVADILVMRPASCHQIFISLYLKAFIQYLVQIGRVVSEKIQFDFLYVHDIWPRSRNDFDLIASLFALRSNAIQRGEAALKKQALWYRDRKFATALKLIFFRRPREATSCFFLRTREGLIFLRRNKICRHFFLNCLRFALISHKDSTLIKVKFCYIHLK